MHFHCCVIDAVFAASEVGQIHFAEAEELVAVQRQVRARVLRWLARAGTLDPVDARDMAGWDHAGGFSLDASVRRPGPRRPGVADTRLRAQGIAFECQAPPPSPR